MNKKLLIIIILWSILHSGFFHLNDVLKVADSFAYLQMSHFFSSFSLDWFWNWWFWFFYSILISIVDILFWDSFFSARILNIVLFWIWAVLLSKISSFYLRQNFVYLTVVLYYLSSILLHFNVAILSENIYIPLFLAYILSTFVYYKSPTFKNSILLWFLIALMYLTRWEAFLYLLPAGILTLFMFVSWQISFKKMMFFWPTILLSFFLIISPYIYYLYTFTGEIWLTNKGASNFRQAQMRGIEKQDDVWFERAVWELTNDNKSLIAWFAWGLKYEKPQIEWWIKDMFFTDTKKTFYRWFENQKKLYTHNLVRISSGLSLEYYFENKRTFFSYILMPSALSIPLFMLFWALFLIYDKKYNLVFIPALSFIIASTFFTIFFVLDRYFIVFLPIWLIFVSYFFQRVQDILKHKYKNIIVWLVICFSLISQVFWLKVYADKWENEDYKYSLKKEAWEYLFDNNYSDRSTQIMERFPVVTYYSWTKIRILTPYALDFDRVLEYAKHNQIDFIVVDTIDFQKYRPQFDYLLDETKKHKWLEYLKHFEDEENKVIIYKFTHK